MPWTTTEPDLETLDPQEQDSLFIDGWITLRLFWQAYQERFSEWGYLKSSIVDNLVTRSDLETVRSTAPSFFNIHFSIYPWHPLTSVHLAERKRKIIKIFWKRKWEQDKILIAELCKFALRE